MNKPLIFLLIGLLAPVYGLAEPVERIGEFLQQKRYMEAVFLLHNKIETVNHHKKPFTDLMLGVVYLRNAQLHQSLYEAALASQIDYLGKLINQKATGKNAYIAFYLGEAYLEAGRLKQAMQFIKKARRGGLDNHHKKLAGVLEAVIWLKRKQRAKAGKMLAAAWNSRDVEIKSQVAVVYHLAGWKKKQVAALWSRLAAQDKLSLRTMSNLLKIGAGDVKNTTVVRWLRDANLAAPLKVVKVKGGAEVRLFNPALLGNMAENFRRRSVWFLQQAAAIDKYKITGEYLLAEAYFDLGDLENAAKLTEGLIQSSRATTKIKVSSRIRKIAAAYVNRGGSVDDKLLQVAREYSDSPALIGEIVLLCVKIKSSCKHVVDFAKSQLNQGAGGMMRQLYYAIGKYYAQNGQLELSMVFLESARDKARKNHIDANDPMWLVDLAEVYRKIKIFPENLEIFFEMSKHFPAVRQIQNSVQGIYSMEQRSAGDVKIL